MALAAATAQPSGTPLSDEMRASLEEIPRPELSREEEAIRQQMERGRQVLDELLASPEVTVDALAAAYGRLGRLYFVYDLNEVAPAAFRNAIRLQPDDYRWSYYLAAHQTFEGEFAEAEELLRGVMELRPDDLPTRVRLGDLLFDRGEEEEAEKHYRFALEHDPESVAALAGLGRLAQRRDQHKQAIELVQRALELRPDADTLHHTLAMSYRALGDRDKAREHLALNQHNRLKLKDPLIEALALENLSSEARFQAGNDAMRRGDMEQAAEFFRAFLRVKPDDATARHNLGVCLLTTGHWEEGLAELRRSIEIDPDYRGGHYSLGSALVEDGLFEEGLSHYRRAHEIDPDDKVIWAEYATLLAKVGNSEMALEELRTILEEDRDQDYARLKYGAVLALSGRSQEAREVLERIAESVGVQEPLRAEALFHLGVLAEKGGDGEAALEAWRRALELHPKSGEAAAALAQSLARSRRFVEAADYFDRAVEVQTRDERIHFGRAMALILAADYRRARAALEESLEKLPDSVAIAHALARLLATCPDPQVRDGAAALDLAQQVMSRQQTFDHAETLAMALAETGRFEDAVALQRNVLERTAAGDPSRRPRQERLQRYQSGEAVRSPWLDS